MKLHTLILHKFHRPRVSMLQPCIYRQKIKSSKGLYRAKNIGKHNELLYVEVGIFQGLVFQGNISKESLLVALYVLYVPAKNFSTVHFEYFLFVSCLFKFALEQHLSRII